jgi:hypothetical protein
MMSGPIPAPTAYLQSVNRLPSGRHRAFIDVAHGHRHQSRWPAGLPNHSRLAPEAGDRMTDAALEL